MFRPEGDDASLHQMVCSCGAKCAGNESNLRRLTAVMARRRAPYGPALWMLVTPYRLGMGRLCSIRILALREKAKSLR